MAAVCSSRDTEISINARGGRQEATIVPAPGFAATAKLWTGMDHCPHLPGSLSSLAPQGSHNAGPTPLGKCMIHLRLWWPLAGPNHGGHSPDTATVSAITPILLNPTELVNPIKCYSYPLVYGQRIDTKEWSTIWGRPQTKREHQGLWESRKEESPLQLQVQWIKSPQLA